MVFSSLRIVYPPVQCGEKLFLPNLFMPLPPRIDNHFLLQYSCQEPGHPQIAPAAEIAGLLRKKNKIFQAVVNSRALARSLHYIKQTTG
jgi:hypothetical protein